MLSIGSLFSGIGGLELGLEWAGLGPVIYHVEIDPLCQRILQKHWPEAEIFSDITKQENYPVVDLLCGGFPCQDISSCNVNGRLGLEGGKSGLWREYKKVIERSRPKFVVVENVSNGKEMWLPTVRRDLFMLGYNTAAYAISARDVGALHIRKRIFVVGNTDTCYKPTRTVHEKAQRMQTHARPMRHWRDPLPSVLRVDDGIPFGVDRSKALGNAVVPQCSEVVGKIITTMI